MEVSGGSCGPLCQHPSCWRDHRRSSTPTTYSNKQRSHHPQAYDSTPRSCPQEAWSEEEDEGLPTQNVLNLLDDYGEDSRDRYPSRLGGRQLHKRDVSFYSRQPSRNSFVQLKAPVVTPSSLLQPAVKPSGVLQPPPPKPVSRVEVQEVFDLEDLQSQWQETFVSQQYYVWVPKPSASKQKEDSSHQGHRLPSGGLVQSSGSIVAKDLTEEMVPREIACHRLNSKMRRNVRSPNTPQQGQPYVHTPFTCKTPGKDYYYGDLLDRDRLVEALTRAFPKIESESSALSMAYGDVLQQRKMPLQESSVRHGNRNNLEPILAKQIHLADCDSDLGPQHRGGRPTLAQSRGKVDLPQPTASADEPETSAPKIVQKKPLPSIKSTKKEDSSGNVLRVAPIGLSLPELPSGVKMTKPFAYSNNSMDLALHRVRPVQPHPRPPAVMATLR